MLNIYYVWWIFSPNMLGLNISKIKTVFNAFTEIIKKSNFKTIELWVDQGTKVYNRFMQKRLNDIDILM